MSESSSLEDFEENYLDYSSGKGKAKINIFEQNLSSSLEDFEENEIGINIPEQSLPEEKSNLEINSPKKGSDPKISDSFRDRILNKISDPYIRGVVEKIEKRNDGRSYPICIYMLSIVCCRTSNPNDMDITTTYLNKMLEKAESEKYPGMSEDDKERILKNLNRIRVVKEDDENKAKLLENMSHLCKSLGNKISANGCLSQANAIRAGLGMGFINSNNDNPLFFEYLVNTAKSRGYK